MCNIIKRQSPKSEGLTYLEENNFLYWSSSIRPSTVFWCSVQNIFTDVPEYFYRCTENKKICTKQKTYVQNRRSRYTWYKYRRSRHTGEAGKGTRRLTQRRSRLMHRRSRHSEGTTYSSTTRFISHSYLSCRLRVAPRSLRYGLRVLREAIHSQHSASGHTYSVLRRWPSYLVS